VTSRASVAPARIVRYGLAAAMLLVTASSISQQAPPSARIAEALRAGRAEEAIKLAEEWIYTEPADPRPPTLKGIALSQLDRPEDAILAFEAALALQPSYLPALQGVAEIEFRLGRPTARMRLERIVALQPGNPTAHAMLGVLAYAARDCSKALEHFDRGSAAVEADPETLRQRAECNFEAGRHGAAAEDFRQLVDSASGGPHGRHNLGLALNEAGRHAEAVDVLQVAVKSVTVPDIDTLTLLAEAQRAALDPEGALETLQRAVRLYPRNEGLYVQLAEVCIEHGAYDLGLEITEVGDRNVSDSHRILTMRGILLAELGRYEEAEAAFESAIARDPDAKSATVGLSLTLEKTGRADESLDVLRERAERDPTDAVSRFFFAQALIKRGVTVGSPAFDEALEALSIATQHLPLEAPPRIELGKLYLKAGQPERAIPILEQAVGLAPADRQATYNLMIALRRVGRAEDASAMASRMREQLERAKGEEVQRNRFRLVKTDGSGRGP